MGNRLGMTQQLHEAISTVLANGLCVDLETGEGRAGGRVTTLTIGLYPPRETRSMRAVEVQYTQALLGDKGYFTGASQGLCSGDHQTIAPFLEAITLNLDRLFREPMYEAVPAGFPSEASEAWQLLLA